MTNRFRGLENAITDFVSIDFETANSCRCSPCAIGVTIVKNRTIVNSFERLILPHQDYREFSEVCCNVHKITEKKVKNMPEFNIVMQELYPILDNNLVVAHSMSFDGGVLTRTCDLYNIEYPNSLTACTLSIAHALFGNKNCSLPEIFERFGGCINAHHNAQCDSEVCARIMLAFLSINEEAVYKNIKHEWPHTIQEASGAPFEMRKEHPYNAYIKLKEKENDEVYEKIAPELITDLQIKQPLRDKSIVITGDMRISRNSAKEAIIAAGGCVKSSVSKKTDFLVMGNKQDTSLFVNGEKSSKTTKAEILIAEGYPIKIISEDEFLEMIDF